LPRPEGREVQAEPKQERDAPPGQFVSDEHADDCLRFLQEVQEFIRRRTEAGLGRER
jgi:hypothetical protein